MASMFYDKQMAHVKYDGCKSPFKQSSRDLIKNSDTRVEFGKTRGLFTLLLLIYRECECNGKSSHQHFNSIDVLKQELFDAPWTVAKGSHIFNLEVF